MKISTKDWYRLWRAIAVVWWVGAVIILIHLWNDNEFHEDPIKVFIADRGIMVEIDGKTVELSDGRGRWVSIDPDANSEFQWEDFLMKYKWKYFLMSSVILILIPILLYIIGRWAYWLYNCFGEEPEEDNKE